MPESLEKVLLLILGWLFGLLGPAFVNAIKQKREDTACRAAVFSELRSLGRLLTVASHGVHIHRATATDQHLLWMTKQLNIFGNPEDEPIKKFVTVLQSLTGEQRIALLTHTRGEGKATGLQKYSVPVLDARVSALYTFTTGEQIALLGIRTQLGFVDDAVDRARKYNDWTFQKHEGENYKLIIENGNTALDDYARYAENAVERIAAALEAYAAKRTSWVKRIWARCRAPNSRQNCSASGEPHDVQGDAKT